MKKPLRLLSCALALGLAAAVPSVVPGAQAKESKRYPGLPQIYAKDYSVSDTEAVATSVGLGESLRARQYFRLPVTSLRAISGTDEEGWVDTTCTRQPPFSNRMDFVIPVWAAAGSNGHGLGYFPELTVRSVAFGSIPVEVHLEISQTIRPEDGFPTPLMASTKTYVVCSLDTMPAEYVAEYGRHADGISDQLNSDSKLTGDVNIRVTALAVDGVSVPVGTHCSTTKPASLNLSAADWWMSDVPKAEQPSGAWKARKKSKYYLATDGGPMSGNISIPSFSGCASGADDVSAVITSAVSGAENPVEIYQSVINSGSMCDASGKRDAATILRCAGAADPFEYPAK
ncbi:hypothetical protein [Nocardioides sp.]|uniref:hypothetical protein n=1 Tax=Nocardioides sp. TaxID=35761 RepID=UPI00261842C2|nr:hypothetical protein [Nocardioides sp.]